MKFKKGEIAIIVNPDKGIVTGADFSHLNGEECTVIGFDHFYDYLVDVAGVHLHAMEYELRKKPADTSTTGWEHVAETSGFVPNREDVEA